MPKFLNTEGQATLMVAICDRCNNKRMRDELIPDGNSPGLMVCRPTVRVGCWDRFDPYRLPARQPDKLTHQWARSDVPLIPDP